MKRITRPGAPRVELAPGGVAPLIPGVAPLVPGGIGWGKKGSGLRALGGERRDWESHEEAAGGWG